MDLDPDPRFCCNPDPEPDPDPGLFSNTDLDPDPGKKTTFSKA
jgi:hypothetical protein